MHYMHYKDYIHHGLAAEKTPPPLPQGGEPSGWVGGGVGVPAHIYIYNMCCNHGPCDIRPKIDFLTSIQDFAMDKTLCAHCFG